jgi:hypothetical protein
MKKVLLCGVLLLTGYAVAESHEEEVVRSTYGTLSFLCGLPPVTHAAMRNEYISQDALNKEQASVTPMFTLADFQVGSIQSIASINWGDMVSVPPKGAALRGTSTAQEYFNDNGKEAKWNTAHVQWINDTSYTPDRIAAIDALDVGQAVALGSTEWTTPATYTSYASFAVTVSFQGQVVGPYKAVFFFGHDKTGKEVIAPQDAVVGQLLWGALHVTAYPSELLKSKLREQPAVDKWIKANRATSQCSKARADLCCAGGRCALPDASVARDLAVPLPN